MSTGVPPGTCVSHGYHGRVACPRCSSSAIPPARLVSGSTERADVQRAKALIEEAGHRANISVGQAVDVARDVLSLAAALREKEAEARDLFQQAVNLADELDAARAALREAEEALRREIRYRLTEHEGWKDGLDDAVEDEFRHALAAASTEGAE